MHDDLERNWDFSLIAAACVMSALMYMLVGMWPSAWGAIGGYTLGVVAWWGYRARWEAVWREWSQVSSTEREEPVKSKAA